MYPVAGEIQVVHFQVLTQVISFVRDSRDARHSSGKGEEEASKRHHASVSFGIKRVTFRHPENFEVPTVDRRTRYWSEVVVKAHAEVHRTKCALVTADTQQPKRRTLFIMTHNCQKWVIRSSHTVHTVDSRSPDGEVEVRIENGTLSSLMLDLDA